MVNLKRLRIFLVLASISLASLGSLTAQSIPGVYGGVPPGLPNSITQAKLTGNGLNIVLPLNGARNYVFTYYNGVLLPAGTYNVVYLDSSGTQVAAASRNPETYNGSLTGVQADPPNSDGVPGALGIQGTFLDGSNGNRPLSGTAKLTNSSGAVQALLLLSNGFFSFYYSISGPFVPPGTYTISFNKMAGKGKFYEFSESVNYQPSTVPGSGYFVNNATFSIGTQTLFAQCPDSDPNCNNP